MKRHRRKKRRHIPVPLASMGDIAFLLIIFFMLLSNFQKNPNVPIDPPMHQAVEKTEKQVAARVAVDKDGVIYFDGDRVDSAKDVEWGVRALLNDTVTDDERHVLFTCDITVPKEQFEPVLKAIAEGGGIIEAVGEKSQ